MAMSESRQSARVELGVRLDELSKELEALNSLRVCVDWDSLNSGAEEWLWRLLCLMKQKS